MSTPSAYLKPLRQPTGTSLHPIFEPTSVAIVGATEKLASVGRSVVQNLLNGRFQGKIFPVNPNREEVLGIPCFPSLTAIGEKVDLAVIATPARTVPEVIRECVARQCAGAVVISAGFKETGPEGARLEQQLLEEAHQGDLRVIGPNCLGIMTPRLGLNATFSETMARPGRLAFISQSGALCTAILDWSLGQNIGFSSFVSIGSMADVGWGDLIDYLGSDPYTRAIVLYMETVGDARSFMSSAREVALNKPLIVIKPGRTSEAAQAAASHTGSMAGSDEVLDAAFRRVGVLRVDTLSELFDMAEVLAKQAAPRGPRLTVLTNAGGPGVLAADAVITEGGQLAALGSETEQRLDQVLPPHWSHRNPIDIIGDATPDRYKQALAIAAADPETDGLLVILTPQGITEPVQVASALVGRTKDLNKPVLACWMGGSSVSTSEAVLNQAGIPTFPYPDAAAKAFCHMWRYGANLANLYETPHLGRLDTPVDRDGAYRLLEQASQGGSKMLSETASKELLEKYGIPTVKTRLAGSPEEAVRTAEAIGYPVVLKLHSTTLTHKSDVGGVRLNLGDAGAVRKAFQGIAETVERRAGKESFEGVSVQPMVGPDGFELIVGSTCDAQFGPVLLFGTGGRLVESLQDRSLGLPPLNSTLARHMMERTRIYPALKRGFRGQRPVDLERIEQLLVRFSWMVADQERIQEVDINPLFVSEETIMALDARVVLGDAKRSRPGLAIRPYPVQYVSSHCMPTGERYMIRPIRPEDEPAMVQFHATLSEQSVYRRFFHRITLGRRVDHFRLTRQCFIDYDRELALVLTRRQPEGGEEVILGVARLRRLPRQNAAEFAILLSDQFQKRGLGRLLMERLLEAGWQEGLEEISGHLLPDNIPALRLCRRLGFELQRQPGDTVLARIGRDAKARIRRDEQGS